MGRGLLIAFMAAMGLVACDGKSPVASTLLNIASTPYPNARILVDGTAVGCAPVRVRILEPGPVDIYADAPGYRAARKTFDASGEGELAVEIQLEPLVGYISVESTPPLARVVLDGKLEIGTTPLVGRPVPIGEHTYEIQKEDFEPQQQTLNIQQDYRYRFNHELKPMQGRVEVFSRPSGASLWIDNRPQKEQTPARLALPPGTYTISAYAKGFIMAESVVRVDPNTSRTVEFELKEGEAPMGMVLVPAGEFVCGVNNAAPDERPQRKINLDAFYIDKLEVTNEQFKAVFQDHKFEEGEERFPVTGVTFEEAQSYAQAVGKRLPTEEEWEKAARGADGREYPWGDRWDPTLCNSSERPGAKLQEVGRYPQGASPCGCLDMAGNVSEWTSSWYRAYPGNTDIRREYALSLRVLRGGSYKTPAFDVRGARRHYDRLDSGKDDYGFRCAQDASETERQQR